MTSLEAQLRRLSVPYTQTVLAPDRARASLLFDPKEAANLDHQTIYALGVTGLEELEGLDPAFSEYTSSLFTMSSQTWERSLQTSEVNEQLDKTLSKFLVQLSPYFLLRSAHKALEWLIRRYHIHQMNVEALLSCVFPYHETKMFARVMQLLPVTDPTNKWHWLQPSAKSGVQLSRSTIVTHCRSDLGFMTFICDLVPNFIKVLGAESSKLRTVVSLWACTMLGVIQERHHVTEKILSILVPAVVRGLKSRCVDHQAAAYMVLAQLSANATLKSHFTISLIPALTKRMLPQLSKEGLVCLALVVRSQNVSQLDKKTCRRICRIPGFVSVLSMLCEKYEMAQFLQVFLEWLVPQAVKSSSVSSSSDASDDEIGYTGPVSYASIMVGILTDVSLDSNQAKRTAKQLLKLLVERCATNVDETKWRPQAVELLSPLQSRYAVPTDLAIEDIVKEFPGKNNVQRKALQHVLSAAMGGARGMLIEGSTSLVLSLNHAHAATRVLALGHLADLLDKEKELLEGITEESLLYRLTDDDISVVKAALDMRKVLVRMVSHEKLVDALLQLVGRLHNKPDKQAILGEAVDFLCGEELSDISEKIEMALVPYLYVNQVHATALATPTFIMKSHLATRSAVLKNYWKQWMKACEKIAKPDRQNVAHLNNIVIEGFSSVLLQEHQQYVKKMLDDFVEGAKTCSTMRQVLLATASATLGRVDDADAARDIASAVLCAAPIELRQYPKNKERAAILWQSLTAVVKVLKRMEHQLPATSWWKEDSDFVRELVMTLDMLVTTRCGLGHSLPQCEQLVKCITQDILGPEKLVSVAALLLTFSLSGEPDTWRVSAVLQVAIVHLVAREWQRAEGDRLAELLNSSTCPALPWLLMCLASKHEAIRCGALGCVKTARKVCGKNLKTCSKLMKLVTVQEEEITNDPSHVQNIIARTLKKNEELQDSVVCWVGDATAPPSVREGLVLLLTAKPNEVIMNKLMPVGLELLKTCKEDASRTTTYTDIIKHLLVGVRVEFAPNMGEQLDMFAFLITALNTSSTTSGTSLRQVVLKQVSAEFFHGLPTNKAQHVLLAEMLNVGVRSDTPEEANQVHRTLQQASLEWVHIKGELMLEDVTLKAKTVKASRRTRRPVLEEKTWQRLTVLLEVLQRRKNFEEPEAVAMALFTLLAKLEKKDGEEWEYRQGLILSLLHNLTVRWQKQQVKPSEGSVDVEGLVKVVRNPRLSRQTKQTAISVMANLAHFFPEYLLHHIMSIFTFVGTGLLAADDAHSLTMVTRTITSIVPAVLQSIHTKSQESRDGLVNQVIQVFVEAQRSIPRHRSLGVFTTVIETLGPESALWRALTLIVMLAVKTPQPSVGTHEGPQEPLTTKPMDADIEFAVNICEQFEPAVQVSAATDVVRFLQGLTEQHTLGNVKPTREKTSWRGGSVVDLEKLSSQQMRLLQFHLTRLVIQLLSNNTLITQVVSAESGSDTAGFSEFVKETVVYMLVVVRTHSIMGKPQVKFWKALLVKVYEVIDKVVYLLATPALIEVVTSLVGHDLPGVRRKALELLASKLQSLQLARVTDAEQEVLLEVLDTLMPIAVGAGHSGDADVAPIQQMALFNIKLLCKLLGEANPQKFINVLKCVMEMIGTEVVVTVAPPVVGSALLVVAEVVTSLRAHAIPYLGPITNPLLQLLANANYIAKHELLLTSGLTALHRLVTALPNFLSPYIRHIITIVCRLAVLDTTSDQRSQSAQRLAAIRHQMATVVASRVLIPALADSFSDLSDKNELTQGVLVSLMSIAKEHVTCMARVDLTAHQTPLLNFFCSALDFRTVDTELSLSEVDAVEDATINAILSMVVRLSEDTFRPMFYKLYDWACREDTEETRKRKLTFFRLADSLAAKLRSLFNLFIGHALQVACQILVANNSLSGEVTYFGSDAESVQLSCAFVGCVLDCLTKCMSHDTDGIFTGDIFNMLLQPLVDQLENFVGGEEVYEQRMTGSIVPCLSRFMVAAKEDSHQKALNYQVLLKTRNSSPKVRFGALRVMAGMAQQLGDDFVFLLPETIPFLAELMEDECEDVERECQQVVSQLEEVLGESLQKYF